MPTSIATHTGKFDARTEIISNEDVAQDHYLLYCVCPQIAENALPGQFVHVLISSDSGLLLRRPFTIYSIRGAQISMLYQVTGEGTAALARMRSGAPIQVLGPLGKAFHIPSYLQAAILVGGGAGIASLMLLAAELKKAGVRTLGLVGATSRARLLSVSDLRRIDVETRIATDDGSVGHHGFVTEILDGVLETPSSVCAAKSRSLRLRAKRYVARGYGVDTGASRADTTCHGESNGVCIRRLPRLRLPGPHRRGRGRVSTCVYRRTSV